MLCIIGKQNICFIYYQYFGPAVLDFCATTRVNLKISLFEEITLQIMKVYHLEVFAKCEGLLPNNFLIRQWIAKLLIVILWV